MKRGKENGVMIEKENEGEREEGGGERRWERMNEGRSKRGRKSGSKEGRKNIVLLYKTVYNICSTLFINMCSFN